MRDFGRRLRAHRTKAKLSMGQLARHLGVSVAYVSDVERGRRAPLGFARIQRLASLLPDAAVRDLQLTAGRARGAFELPAEKGRPKALEVAASLMRDWSQLSDEQLEGIEVVLARRRGGGDASGNQS
jgi:transcriptional regulator with XRE-family HTH domain